MLSGDDLSIQLFIAALGITVVGIAITQAGWTHRWFVRALFVGVGIILVIAISWGPISRSLPRTEFLADITTSSWAWLLLLVVSFVSLGWFEIRAREKWASRLPKLVAGLSNQQITAAANEGATPQWPNVTEWMTPEAAVDAFADQEMGQEFLAAQARFESFASEEYELNARLDEKHGSELNKLINLTRRSNPEPGSDEERLQALTQLKQEAHTKILRLRDRILDSLLRRLRSGELAARGVLFEENQLPGDWIILPPAAWVVLKFDTANLETAHGGGKVYKGIQIGKPDVSR